MVRFAGRAGACASKALIIMLMLVFAGGLFPRGAFGEPQGELQEEPQGELSSGSASDDAASAELSAAEQSLARAYACLLDAFGSGDVASFLASDELDPADGTGAWLAFDFARLGQVEDPAPYLERIERYIVESYAGDMGGLDDFSATAWSRTALVAAAFGADPQAMEADAQGNPVNLLKDGIYDWSYTDSLGDQGSNAWIYALEALDALQVEPPAGARYTPADMLEGLLACQAPDGSFGLQAQAQAGSVDMTGMALAALGPHAHEPQAAAAINAALEYLSEEQCDDGSFLAEGEATSESSSMVVIGLSACGIDADADERFSKPGGSALSALLAWQKEDGSFAHVAGEDGDRVQRLATEQALRALCAYLIFKQGEDANVYDPLARIGGDALDALLDSRGADGGADVALQAAGGLWGARMLSAGIGAAAACALVFVVWAVRRVRRGRRLAARTGRGIWPGL